MGIRISTNEDTGFPSSMAGKKRQRRSASRRPRLSEGSSVACTSSTVEEPSAATSNRATATTSIFCRRSASGISGSGLKMARAESLPPPRLSPRISGGCDPASLGAAAAFEFSDALESCALASETFGGGRCRSGGVGRVRSGRVRFGSGGLGATTGSGGAALSRRAPPLGPGISTSRASSVVERIPGSGGSARTRRNTSSKANDSTIAPGRVQGSRCQGLSAVCAPYARKLSCAGPQSGSAPRPPLERGASPGQRCRLGRRRPRLR
jgi:hypothetical protein